MSTVSLEDFKKIELKTGVILSAEEIPGADRIWKLTVSTGGDNKILVAGIKNFYDKESLIGKNVVIVNNLAPTVIRGVESQGMVLAAKCDNRLTLLTLDKELPAGSLIY